MKENQEEASAYLGCPWFWALTALLWGIAVNCREEGEKEVKSDEGSK